MHRFTIQTQAHAEFRDITREIRSLVVQSTIRSGIVHVYIPHTTAGITVNENADPDVKADMLASLDCMVPWEQPHFRHGEGNSAAHIKASMMGSSATLIVEDSRLQLGQWQGVYLCEFDGPRNREVWVRMMKDEG